MYFKFKEQLIRVKEKNITVLDNAFKRKAMTVNSEESYDKFFEMQKDKKNAYFLG